MEMHPDTFRRMVEMVNRPNSHLAHMPHGTSISNAIGRRVIVVPSIPHQFDSWALLSFDELEMILCTQSAT